ncbi:hypothetical protein OAQ86_03860 [Candidatus Pseudothioglobus singularis]|nr:hypothetical protein [Candidatus Pseudothioglobus singularis]
MKSSSYSESVEKYNNSIRDLWRTNFKKAICSSKNSNVEFKQFCFHVNQDESPIWFFGMNPSLLDSTNEFISQTTPPDKHLFKKLEEEQKYMHTKIQYFKRAKVFFEEEVKIPELRKPIFHDLYPVRHTNQKEFVQFIEHEENKEFLEELDKETKNLIDGIMPEIIVIANAKASELMQKIFFRDSEAEKIKLNGETKRTYKFNGKKTDMIFSSMLSGQRALDTYSRSRLAREISETWKDRNN